MRLFRSLVIGVTTLWLISVSLATLIAQSGPPIPIDQPFQLQIESDGSGNGPIPVSVCGFAFDAGGLSTIVRVSARWVSLRTGEVRTSPVAMKLPRPDLALAFPHLTSYDLGFCTIAPFTYGEGSWQVTLTATSNVGALPATYSFTVTAPVDMVGNPFASFVPDPSGQTLTAHVPVTLMGAAYDRASAPTSDGITSVILAGRRVAEPASPAILLASAALTHYTDPHFPAQASWIATVTFPDPGLWDITVVVSGPSGVNRQMFRVNVQP